MNFIILYPRKAANKMNDSTSNIYKTARLRAGMKRDPVAEELHIDVRTLDKYEALDGKVPDETVKQMCILYNNSFLGYQHLKRSPLGEFLPELTEETLKGATLTMVDDINTVNDRLKNIIKIMSDGVINEDERPEWERNRKEMTRLVSSLLTLLLTSE